MSVPGLSCNWRQGRGEPRARSARGESEETEGHKRPGGHMVTCHLGLVALVDAGSPKTRVKLGRQHLDQERRLDRVRAPVSPVRVLLASSLLLSSRAHPKQLGRRPNLAARRGNHQRPADTTQTTNTNTTTRGETHRRRPTPTRTDLETKSDCEAQSSIKREMEVQMEETRQVKNLYYTFNKHASLKPPYDAGLAFFCAC